MEYRASSRETTRWENHLLGLSSLVALVSLAFIVHTPGPRFFTIPEVVIPLGTSLALSLYTVRLQRRDRGVVQFKPMVTYGWAGAVVSAAIGGLWMALHVYYGLPIDVLPDKLLTILSVGIAAGVFVGREASTGRRTDRFRLLEEASWASRSGPTPIMAAIVDALADVEGVEPLELDPLYDHVDPDVLSELRSQDSSRWQLLFYTDEYEVRVSGHGTVSVYSLNEEREATPTVSSR